MGFMAVIGDDRDRNVDDGADGDASGCDLWCFMGLDQLKIMFVV